MSLKYQCQPSEEGYYNLSAGVTVPTRIFFTEKLYAQSEEGLYSQIKNATEYPGVLDVSVTPDAHIGSTVPVGSVIATDGTLLHSPVGYDIGCFTGDTLVPTADGNSYTLRDLAERTEDDLFVYSLNSIQRVTVTRAFARKTRSNASLLRITLDNGREIICTPDHEFMLRDGSYCQAQNLSEDASLMPFYSERDKDGYVLVQHPATGYRQRVHWMVARAGLLGKIPKFNEQKTIIHHRNFKQWDNHPQNLEFMGNRDHGNFHRVHVEKLKIFQSELFQENRKKALAEKAKTPEGHAYFAERGTRNIKSYMEQNPEHFKESVAGNGERGKAFLVAYNQSERGKAKSKEIGSRVYTCEICGKQVKSGLGLSGHRRWKHGFNHRVISIEQLERTEDVYCLTVPDYGNFALDAGVFVHNCGILCFRSDVPVSKGRDERLKRKWSEEVMKRVGIGVGERGNVSVTRKNLQEILRHGANALHYRHEQTERDFLPLDDDWTAPAKATEKGLQQLCSLGGGNHFIELQYDQDGFLWGMIHTGSRGFGYQLAAHYIALAREEMKARGNKSNLDATYFLPDSPHWSGYKNAVSAGGNFATANRLMIWEQVATAFRRVFGAEPELYYEISHNLAQKEVLPDGREAWVHRKGATRAFPAGHSALVGTKWATTGHPVLIPGSMGDNSYILFPRAGVANSLYSVNHGCGRQFSRSEARQRLSQSGVNKQMKSLGVMVNGGGVDVPIDESPDVYKPAKEVIAAVLAANLAEVHTTLTPLATIKGCD